MSSEKFEKLFFTVSLIDKLTGPASKMTHSVEKMYVTGRAGLQNLGKGTAAFLGAGMMLDSLTGSARDFQKAVNEVGSLGVAQDELEKLGNRGKEFAMQFGGSAAEIVRSGYDIQSAIPGLAKGALADFTYQGAVLAKAGKASAATITSYMGTMYNIFKEDAQKIGDAEWVAQLSGKTAHAIKIFKTTGDNMSAAFTNLGSNAKTAGVSMEEQIAILGQLQGTMGGANAGTAYSGFLNKTTDAAGKLGLKFTDANKRLLPMTDILEKIKNKYADSSGKVNEFNKDKIMKAFGETGGKAVLNLLSKTNELKGSISELTQIKDESPALGMAQKMTDAYERFCGTLDVLKMTVGTTVLPVVDAVLNCFSSILSGLVWCSDNCFLLRWAIGLTIGAITACSVALGILWTVSGGYKIIQAIIMKVRIMTAWTLKYSRAVHSGTFAHKIATGVMWIWNNVLSWTAIKTNSLKIKTFLLNDVLHWTTVKTKAAAWGMGVWNNVLSWTAIKTNISVGAQWLWNGAVSAGKGFSAALAGSTIVLGAQFLWMKGCALVSSAATWILNGGFIALGASLWGVVAALWATGIPEIILLIVGLGAAVFAMVYYWDEWTGALITFGKWCWDGVISAFQTLCGWFDFAKCALGDFGAVLYAIPILGQIMALRVLCGWISELWSELESLAGFLKDVFIGTVEAIWSPFRDFFAWLWEKFTAIPGLLSEISFLWDWIPGMGSSTESPSEKVQNLSGSGFSSVTVPTVAPPPVVPAVQKARTAPPPGIGPRNTNTNHNTNFGGVTINARTFPTPGQLEEWSLLNG